MGKGVAGEHKHSDHNNPPPHSPAFSWVLRIQSEADSRGRESRNVTPQEIHPEDELGREQAQAQ